MVRPDGDGVAELAQQPADRIDAGGSSGQPGGARRCRAVRACWETDFTGTGWMSSLRNASSRPRVSVRSVLLRNT
jgi:hypothetical protein